MGAAGAGPHSAGRAGCDHAGHRDGPAPAICSLCGNATRAFCEDRVRRYFECPGCGLVSADPASHLSPEDERAIYDLHQNDPADAGYRRFLSRMADPLVRVGDPADRVRLIRRMPRAGLRARHPPSMGSGYLTAPAESPPTMYFCR